MSYAEQLKKPQWQKKRLEIMSRDEFTCQMCGDTEGTLSVHHKSYRNEKGKFADIWDYQGDDLVTLCDSCHSSEESMLKLHQKTIYFRIRSACFDAEAMSGLMIMVDMYKEHLGRRLTVKDIGDLCLCFTEKNGK